MTIKDGQNWCSDFGQYLTGAENIISHKEYSHTYYLGKSVVTPPGFPFILTPILKIFGLNFKLLKIPNVIFLLGYILLLYSIMRRRLSEEDALLGVVLLGTSADFFIYKQYIMTDIPFLFFITASVFFWIKYDEAKTDTDSGKQFIALTIATLLMCYAFFIRWAGILLFIAAMLYFSSQKKDKRAIIFLTCGLFISIFIQKMIGTNGLNYYYEVARPSKDWAILSYNAVLQTIKAMAVFFFPCKTKFTLLIFSFLGKSIPIIGPILFALIVFAFICRLKNKSLTLVECFFTIYIVGSLLWYYSGGTRYIYPIIGFVILFLVDGSRFLSKYIRVGRINIYDLARVLILFIIFHNVISVSFLFKYNDDQIAQKDAMDLVEWIKNNTHKDDRLVFGKPRELGFLTKREVTSYAFLREGDVCQGIKQLHVRYFVYEDYKKKYLPQLINLVDLPFQTMATNGVRIPAHVDSGQFSLQTLQNCQYNIRQVWGEDRDYKIYKINPVSASKL